MADSSPGLPVSAFKIGNLVSTEDWSPVPEAPEEPASESQACSQFNLRAWNSFSALSAHRDKYQGSPGGLWPQGGPVTV